MRVTIDVASYEFVINEVTISYCVEKGYILYIFDEKLERKLERQFQLLKNPQRLLKLYDAEEDPDWRYGYYFMWSTSLHKKIRINCNHAGRRWQATSVQKAILGMDLDTIEYETFGTKMYDLDYYYAALPKLKVTVLE